MYAASVTLKSLFKHPLYDIYIIQMQLLCWLCSVKTLEDIFTLLSKWLRPRCNLLMELGRTVGKVHMGHWSLSSPSPSLSENKQSKHTGIADCSSRNVDRTHTCQSRQSLIRPRGPLTSSGGIDQWAPPGMRFSWCSGWWTCVSAALWLLVSDRCKQHVTRIRSSLPQVLKFN